MKKILFLFCTGLFVLSYQGHCQNITDTGTLRTAINADIVTNGSKLITATKVNRILNGIVNTMHSYGVDSAYIISPDTLVLVRRGGYSNFKIKLPGIGAGAEIDPNVSGAAKAITNTDTTNWNLAYRKRISSLIFDSATKLLTVNFADGSFVRDTINITGGGGGGGSTNLGQSRNGTTYTVTSSTGASTVLQPADNSNAGVITTTQKKLLDTLANPDSVRIYRKAGSDSVFMCVKPYPYALETCKFQFRDSLAAGGGAGSPGGSDTYVQFNDGSTFGGDAGLLYNKTQNKVTTDTVVGLSARWNKGIFFDPNAGAPYKIQINPVSSTAGHVQFQYTETNNFDDGTVNPVLWIGHNLDLLKSAFGDIHLGIEGNFQPFPGSTDRWFEFHAPEVAAKDGSWRYRPASWIGSKTSRAGSWMWHADTYNWFKAANDSVIMAFDNSGGFQFNAWSDGSSYWDYSNKQYGKNFRVNVTQLGDVLMGTSTGGVMNILAPRVYFGQGEANSIPLYIHSSNIDGTIGFYHEGTVTGYAYMGMGQVSASSGYLMNLDNTNTGSTGNAYFQAKTAQTGGNPGFYINKTNVRGYWIQLDRADNGLKIQTGTSYQGNDIDLLKFHATNYQPTFYAQYVMSNNGADTLATRAYARSIGGGGGGFTFTNGLTESGGTVSNNLITGKTGGQTVIGGTGTTDKLIFKTTTGTGASGADFVFTGGNNGASEFARFLNNGNFGIGDPNPGSPLVISRDQDAITEVNVNNNFAGTSVHARFGVYINGASAFFGCYSATAGAAGALSPAATYLQGTSSTGIVLMATDDAAPIKFATGSAITERGRFNSGGELQIGSTTDQGSYTLQNTGGFYQSGSVKMDLGSDANYDLYYRNSSGVLTRLANGTSGQILQANTSAAPSWGSGLGPTAFEFTTSDATPTTEVTISPVSGESITVVATLNGVKSNGDASVHGTKSRSFLRNSSGTLTASSEQTDRTLAYLGSGLSTATFTITTSGSNIIIQFTGEASTSINGKITYTITREPAPL